ncbi:MAG: hypothetical protein HY395_03245 [Candidatus Doudnabacteria bacterium]|nr:hypothetical protein [Candidatus Doudnabacteria bacterium]
MSILRGLGWSVHDPTVGLLERFVWRLIEAWDRLFKRPTYQLVVVPLPKLEDLVTEEDVDRVLRFLDVRKVTNVLAAAMDYQRVLVVVDAADYGKVIARLTAGTTLQFHYEMAVKAMAVCGTIMTQSAITASEFMIMDSGAITRAVAIW